MIRELVDVGATVLLTTQYLEEADRLAERVAVIDDGRVIADDTPAALKSALGSTVVELSLGDDERAVRAEALLGRELREPVKRDLTVVTLTSQDGARMLIDALRILEGEGLTPTR